MLRTQRCWRKQQHVGEVGTVSDFLIDDERWTVRYLVAETGHF